MFSYYGSKSKIAHLYPPPKYGRIIEPFAGSARYSLLHFENDVTLFDANPVIVRLWEYLIAASESDILSLPDVESKKSLDEIKELSQPERDLIGFHLCRGKAKPRKVGHGQNSWNRDKLRIAGDLHKIRHWQVARLSFEMIGLLDVQATWFIDPPYQHSQVRTNGDRYPVGDGINYAMLAQTVGWLNGQVIVCEGDGADWLPFSLLKEVSANTNNRTVKRLREYVYVQDRLRGTT